VCKLAQMFLRPAPSTHAGAVCIRIGQASRKLHTLALNVLIAQGGIDSEPGCCSCMLEAGRSEAALLSRGVLLLERHGSFNGRQPMNIHPIVIVAVPGSCSACC
jgi:hypothetical protein